MDLDEETQFPDWMFKAAAVLAGLFTLLAVAFAMIPAESEPEVMAPVASHPTMLVVETETCGWCRRFRQNVAPHYERSHLDVRAPLKYIDLADVRRSGYHFSSRVRAVPTFVLVDRSGREAGRIGGYIGGPEVFIPEVERMLTRLPADG